MYHDENINSLNYKFNNLNLKLKELYDAKDYKSAMDIVALTRDATLYQPFFRQALKDNLISSIKYDSQFLAMALGHYVKGDKNNNSLSGTGEADVLEGLEGNDSLSGGSGDDTYKFEIGFGKDTIYDSAGNDKIVFGNGISKENIKFIRDLSSLKLITIDTNGKDSGNNIEIQNFFCTQNGMSNGTIESIEFSNGVKLNTNDTLLLAPLNATDEKDKFYLTNSNDIFDGLGGDDEIYGGSGNDTINGNLGNDALYGNDGSDTLAGDSGDDRLYGGSGDDAYIFAKGFSKDIVSDDGGSDTIEFKDGISKDDLLFVYDNQNSNLTIQLKDGSDSLTINNWGYDKNRAIETIKFANGDILNIENMVNMATIKYINDTANVSYYMTNLGLGDDTYVVTEQTSRVNIHDQYSLLDVRKDGGNDTIEFGDGVKFEDLIFKIDGNNLVLAIKEDGKKFEDLKTAVTIREWFDSYTRIENIKFGSNIMSLSQMILSGDDGVIMGSDNNETINGDSNNNIIYPLKGKDILDGKEGSDTYVLSKGFGSKIINNYDISKDRVDSIKFDESIYHLDAIFKRQDEDLAINFKNSQDSVVVKNFFKNDGNGGYQIDKVMFSGATYTLADIKSMVLKGTNENDILRAYGDGGYSYIYGNMGDDSIYGNIYDDILDGGKGNDTIYGNKGGDQIYGNDGDDTIEGGEDTDYIHGGYGSDTFVFGRGDGNDMIDYEDGNDIIKFKEGINRNDVLLKVKENSFIISLKNSSDSILIINAMLHGSKDSEYSMIKAIEFANGDKISLDEIVQMLSVGTDNNDTLYGFGSDDTLQGGKGDDILYGGVGDDTYIFNKDDGNDTINDNAGNNVLRFGDGITKDDIIVKRSNKYLSTKILSFKNSDDSITINDSVDYERSNSIKNFEFVNGNKLTLEDINLLSLIGQDGDDVIYAYDSNDTLQGNKGNDTLCGEDGDDTYVFNRGDGSDIIYDNSGNNVVRFGEGISKDEVIVQKICASR